MSSANVLTADAAREANLELITNTRGTQVVHDVVTAMRANRRSGTASTKTKATVRGSGKKPYRQKGTGRARAGYLSSPVRVGGGVAFGPHPRDYSKTTSKAMRRLALRKVVSSRILSGDVLVTENFSVTEPKTKSIVALVNKLVPNHRNVLVVSEAYDKTTLLAARNVQNLQLATASDVNVEQLMRYHQILITNSALAKVADRTKKKPEAEDTKAKAPAKTSPAKKSKTAKTA